MGPVQLGTSGNKRRFADAATQRQDGIDKQEQGEEQQIKVKDGEDEGAFTRRMRSMSEEALESGGHSARKAVEEAGFSAELKAQLEQRIASAALNTSEASLPASASRHTRDLATTEAWTGTESIHDASLRMLNDAHKPLRTGRRATPGPAVQMPQNIDTGRKRSRAGQGVRLANARDRTNLYASVQNDAEMEEADRQKRLQELKDRFDPHARTIVPGSIAGLASLANKRIEDAIARGQFKNIPRGKGKNVERDHNASSPFIDTTEYFMNKIIQKQEIVPPWIEKQQELTSAASRFRSRLRADWKRHAARMIASGGGSLQDQVSRAEAYAAAELIANPTKKKVETLTAVSNDGQLSQISLSGELKLSSSDPSGNNTLVSEITAEKVPLSPTSNEESTSQTIQIPLSTPSSTTTAAVDSPTPPTHTPATQPYRDPTWLSSETPYLLASIADLNTKARSYNLQAPELARKPYFSLDRELKSCYADVAPLLPEAIIERARAPVKRNESSFGQTLSERGILGSLGARNVRVMDERTTKQYGFRQFWKDLFREKPKDPYA